MTSRKIFSIYAKPRPIQEIYEGLINVLNKYDFKFDNDLQSKVLENNKLASWIPRAIHC